MPGFLPEPTYQHGALARAAILLVNLGTPDAPTPQALRRYLKQFLSDPRVIEIPRALWLPVLHGFVLNARPKASAQRYARIWSKDGSPLRAHTERQARLLRGYFGLEVRSPFTVDFAMRYGEPSIPGALEHLKSEGCERILVLPLYPQYAASTTASALDEVAAFMKRVRNPAGEALSRPPRVHRSAREPGARALATCGAPRQAAHELSRSSALHAFPRRSLSLRVPEDRAPARRGARACRQPLADRFPVALRAAGMAQTLHRVGPGGLRPARSSPSGRDLPGFRGRLPGDAGGNRHRGQGNLSRRGRQGISPAALLERARRLDPRPGRHCTRASRRLGQRVLESPCRQSPSRREPQAGPRQRRRHLTGRGVRHPDRS